jgi:hypothetical protein
MERHHGSSDAEDLAQVGKATLDALQKRSRASMLADLDAVALRESLSELLVLVQLANPEDWSEDEFAETDEIMGRVIEMLERYQTLKGDEDLTLCMFIGASVKTLREAHGWLVQGLSPNPQLRPSDDELRELAEARSAAVLRDLFS